MAGTSTIDRKKFLENFLKKGTQIQEEKEKKKDREQIKGTIRKAFADRQEKTKTDSLTGNTPGWISGSFNSRGKTNTTVDAAGKVIDQKTPEQDYFEKLYNQAQTAGQELYRNSFLYKPAQAQPVQTTVPTQGTKPATAEDVSKSSYDQITKKLGLEGYNPQALKGTPMAKNTGAATGTGKAKGSGNVDAIDRVLYGSNRAERFTSKVPKVEMQTAPATGKSAPAGNEVPMTEEKAPQQTRTWTDPMQRTNTNGLQQYIQQANQQPADVNGDYQWEMDENTANMLKYAQWAENGTPDWKDSHAVSDMMYTGRNLGLFDEDNDITTMSEETLKKKIAEKEQKIYDIENAGQNQEVKEIADAIRSGASYDEVVALYNKYNGFYSARIDIPSMPRMDYESAFQSERNQWADWLEEEVSETNKDKVKPYQMQLDKYKEELENREKINTMNAGISGDSAYHPEKGAQTRTYSGGGITADYSSFVDETRTDAGVIYYLANHNPYDVVSSETGTTAGEIVGESSEQFLAFHMTPEMVAKYNEYYNSGDEEAALAYFSALKNYLNHRHDEYEDQELMDFASSAQGWKAAVTSVLAKPGTSILGAIGAVGAAVGWEEGMDLDSWLYKGEKKVNLIQETRINNAAQYYADKYGENVGNAVQFIGGVVYSIANNLVAMGLGAGAGNAASAVVQLIMSSEATADIMIEQLEKQKDPTEAAILALGGGVVEWFTEQYSVERYMEGDWKDGLVKEMLKSMAAEGSEEIASDVLNTLLDEIVSYAYDHKSELAERWEELYSEAIAQNMTEEEAKAYANQKSMEEYGNGLLLSGLSGAISAVPLTGASMVAKRNSINKMGSNALKGSGTGTNTENQDFLLETARNMKEDTESHKLGQKIEKRYQKKGKISNSDMGKLVVAIENESSVEVSEKAKATMTGILKEDLVRSGVRQENAEELADIVTKAATQGVEALSKEERGKLLDNEQAYKQYVAMVAPGAISETDSTRNTAFAAEIGAKVATMEERNTLARVRSIAEGKAGSDRTNTIGKDSLKAARASVKVADTATIDRMGGQEAIGNAASTVIAYTNDAEEGNQEKAGQVVGYKNGKVQVQFADGTQGTVSPAYVEIANKDDTNAQGLLGYVKTMPGVMSDDVVTKAFTALNAQGDKASGRFAQDIIELNIAGRTGMAMPKGISIDSETAQEIYNTAAEDGRKADQGRIKKTGKVTHGHGTATFDGAEFGTQEFAEKMGKLDENTREAAEVAAEITKALGGKVEFVYDDSENGKMTNGSYNEQTGVVQINLAATRMTMDENGNVVEGAAINPLATIPHEMTHWLQANSEDGYNRLKNFVLNDLSKRMDIEQLVSKTINQYNKYYADNNERDANGKIRQTSVEDAVYEIVANASEALFTSEEFANRLKNTDETLFGKIKEYVKGLVERLRNALIGSYSSMHREAKMLRDVDEMARIWLGAYDEVIHGEVTGKQSAEVTTIQANEAKKILNDAMQHPQKNFSMNAPVEARDDGMIAVHNLDERSLLSDLAMKGFPMPSIAVLSDKVAWEDYGPISIFFGKNAIDFNEGTVYAGDAYTPAMGDYQATSAEDALAFLRKQKLRYPNAAYSTMDLFNNFIRVQNMDLAREKVNAYRNMDKTERVAEKRRIKAIENSIMDQVAEFLDKEENTNRYTRTEDRFNFDVAYGIMLAAEEINSRENLSQQEKYEILQESLEKAAKENAEENEEENGNKIYDYGKDGNALYDDMLEFIDGATHLASTFIESKPNRILDFGAVNAVVLPNNVADSTIQALKNAGVKNIITYDPSVENARVEALQSVPKNVPNVRFSIFDTDGNEVNLTSEQIEENKKTISNMEPVAVINGERFQKNAEKDFKTMALEYIDSIGGKAENKVFGTINIGEKGIEHLISWLTSRRAGVLEAVKPVLENGEIIDIREPGEDHNFDSAIIGAPIIYKNEPYYMGVIVKQNENKENSYDMHDAVLARIEKGQPPVNKSLSKQALGGDPSVAMILATIPGYNGKYGAKGKNDYSIQQKDEAYERTVQDGNMETAQWMIDSKAEEVMQNSKVRGEDGKLLKMFHGTNAEFNEFRREYIGSTGRFEGSGFNFTPYEGRAKSYGKNVYEGYLDIEKPLSAEKKTISVNKLAQLIREADPTGDNIISNYARETRDYGTEAFIRREALTAARQIWNYSNNDVDIYSEISSADPDAENLISKFMDMGYDGVIHYDDNGKIKTAVAFSSNQFKRSDPVIYEDGKMIPFSERINMEKPDIRYSVGTVEETEDGTIEDKENGQALVQEMDGGVYSAYSIRTVDDTVNDDLIKALVQKGFSRKKVNQWVKDVRGVAKYIADHAQQLDFDPLGGTMLKNNQEYVKTLDSSTLCAKRLLYQGIFNQIQHMLPNTPLLPDDLIQLTNMMKKKGMMTPCSICYVESRRRMLGKYAGEWLKGYNGAYIPRIEEVTTTDGLQKLRESDDEAKRQAAKDFEDAMNAKGSANPKLVQLRSEYRGEIAKMTDKQIQKVKEIGGLRVQSFSDFETVHLLDMMQAVMDMASKDLTSQAYTKVPAFAWVFGNTGIKINLSLIGDGEGVDENGNLVFSSTEGMDINEAIALRNAYSKNVGTILVGMNDKHIIAAMGDDRIDFIIPFHKSGWSKKEMAMMIGMGTYKDYTRWQNEKLIAGRNSKNNGYKTIPNKTSKLTNLEPVGPNRYWNFNKDGTWNAENYLKICAEQHRLPKFANFLIDNGDGSFRLPTAEEAANDKDAANIRKGYWKLLIDFKMYDNEGNGAQQESVQPKFNMEKAYDVMKAYDGDPNALPKNDALAQEYVDWYKKQNPGRKNYSIFQDPDIDIDRWMMSVPEESLQTEAERELLRQYKGLYRNIEIDEDKIRNLKRQIRFWQDKKGLTKEERARLGELKIRLANAQTTMKAHEERMAQVRSQEGYATVMREQQERMTRLMSGKTQQEVVDAMDAMEKSVSRLQKNIDQTTKELNELANEQGVKRIMSRLGAVSPDKVAAKIRKDYNSTINKQELTDELIKIRLMIENNEDVEAITGEIENLAGRVLEKRKGAKNESLEQLRGITLRLGDAAMKELYGSNSNMKEIRKMLAGSGVKIERVKGSGGSLDANWDELVSFVPALDHYNGYDTENALDQAKAVAEFVMNAMDEQRESGKKELKDYMDEVIVDLAGQLSRIDPDLPADPAARKAVDNLKQYVAEIAKRAEIASERIAEVQKGMDAMIAGGRNAAKWNRSMKEDIAQTIGYFNMTAKLAADQARQTRQSEIIQQLKDENVQKIVKNNEMWRKRMEMESDAREQMDENALTRRKMTVITTRLGKLLSSPTNTKNIPEVMNPLARRLVELMVNADLSDSGRKISNIQKKNLLEMKRRLDAWNNRDGVYDPNEIADENIRDIVNNNLDIVEDMIKRWNGSYKGENRLETLKQMGQTLNTMQEAVSEIYTIIQREREIAIGERMVEVADQAEKVKYQTKGKKAKEKTGKLGRAAAAMHSAIISGNMTPEYFFRTLGNSGLNDLWNEYHRAENRNGLELARAQEKIAKIADRWGYKDWDTKKRTTVELEKGGTVNLTLGQLMSLYATWNREAMLGPEMSDHLRHGGFYAEEQDLREGIYGKTTIEKKAHRVTDDDMTKIENILTDEQKNFVDEIVSFMSNDLSEMGNEASMKAYGIKLYKEKYYFPFQMWDGIKVKKSNDSGSAASRDRAFHPSFAKSRMHGANNALVIGDFMQTATDHAVGMINYATMGLANDTFQKVLNYKVNEGTNEDDLTKRSIRAVLEEAYGMEAMSYLKDLQDQLNGGAVATKKSLGDRAISLFRKNAVAGSLSVALQQPLSYLRAGLMINPKYLRKGILTSEYWKGSYQELLQHSGVAVIKDMGRFDMGFGQSAREYLMPESKETGVKKVWNAITDKATILPEKMDAWTWTRMWVAVKAEQKAKHPEMNVKSDEFLDMCGERFNDIMRRTQVYDSVLVKSRNMRSDNYWIKSLTSFMAEPTLTANVLADAVRQVKDKEEGAMGRLAGAGATFILSAVLQAAVKGIMGAGRNPDEKKTFEENFLYRFWSALLNEINPAGLIPGYSDIITLMKKGELSDDAMGAVGKILTAGKTGVDLLLGNGKKGTYRDIEDSVGQIVQLFTNLPAKNIMRDARAMYNFMTQPYAQRDTSWNVIKNQAIEQVFNADNLTGVVNKLLTDAGLGGYGTKNTDYYQRIYDAIKAGDTEKAEELEEYLTSAKGVKEDTVKSGIKKLATEEADVDFMLENDMDPTDLVKKQLKDGKITAEEARKQLKEANPDKDDDSIWWTVDRIEYQKETGKEAGSGTYYRLKDAIGEKDMDTFYEQAELILEHGGNTDDEGECVTDAFRDGKIDRDTATEMMRYVYNKDEKSDDDIWWTLDRIEYQQETGAEKVSGNYYRLYDAMDKNSADAIGNAVNTMVQHGMKKENIKTQIGKKYRQAYLEADNNGKRKIRDAVQKAYKKLGYTAADADKIINGWSK